VLTVCCGKQSAEQVHKRSGVWPHWSWGWFVDSTWRPLVKKGELFVVVGETCQEVISTLKRKERLVLKLRQAGERKKENKIFDHTGGKTKQQKRKTLDKKRFFPGNVCDWIGTVPSGRSLRKRVGWWCGNADKRREREDV